MNTVGWGLVGALLLSACGGGDPVDIGNDEVTGEKLEDYAGSWDGYIEGANFHGGGDRIRFRLEGSGAGVFHFGEGEPYVPRSGEVPRSPPPISGRLPDNLEASGLQVDFEYPISATVDRRHVMISLMPGQPYEAFCRALSIDELGCVDFSPYVEAGSECVVGCYDTAWAVDCAAQLAVQQCLCDSTSGICQGRAPFERWFDGVLSDDGRELEASIGLHDNTRYVVRLQRVE